MTREEFIEILKEKKYSYEIEGDKLIVTGWDVWLADLKTLPPVVEFMNGGDVELPSLNTLPSGVEFKNGGIVDLRSLEALPSGVGFRNGQGVNLVSLKALPPGVVFNNGGSVYLSSLVGGWFKDWSGNIEGLHSSILLNWMINKGMFI